MLWLTVLTAKPQDLIPVWTKSFGGPWWDIANTISISNSGTVFVTGVYTDFIDIEGQRFYSKGFTDVIVAIYSIDGRFLNSFSFGGTTNERPLFSVYDNDFILFVQFQRSFEIGDVYISSDRYANFMLGWFDDKGILTSYSIISSDKTLYIKDMKSNNGAIYLMGWFIDELFVDQNVLSGESGENSFILKLTDKGANTEFFSWPRNEGVGRIYGCAVDSKNQIHIVGISTRNIDTEIESTDLIYNLYAATLNDAGILVDKKKLFKGYNLNPVSVIMNMDKLWIATSYEFYCIENDNNRIKAKGQTDILISSCTEDNQCIKNLSIGGYGKDTPLDIVSSRDNVFLTSSFCDTIWFGDEFLVSHKWGSDVLLALFDSTTTLISKYSIGGKNNDFPRGVSSLGSGIYVLGQFKEGMVVGNDTLATNGSYDIFVSRFENFSLIQTVPVPLWIGGILLLLIGLKLLIRKIGY